MTYTRRVSWLFLRLLATALAILWLAASVEWSALLGALIGASLPIVLLSCALYYFGVVLSCWKWSILLDLEEIDLPFGRLYRWYLMGAFASNYLPTEVGGDVGRIVVAGRFTGRSIEVARSIFAERFSGLIVLALMAWVGLIALLRSYTLALLILVSSFVIVIGAVLFTLHFASATKKRLPDKIRFAVESSVEVWTKLLDRPKSLALIMTISLMFQILAGVGVWLNMRAVGAILPMSVVILAYALSGVVSLLPVTINGWGVREGLLITLLTPFGASASSILAGALLGRALLLLVTLPGGMFMLGAMGPEMNVRSDPQSSPKRERCES